MNCIFAFSSAFDFIENNASNFPFDMLAANNRNAAINDDNNYVHSLPPFANETNKALSKTVSTTD